MVDRPNRWESGSFSGELCGDHTDPKDQRGKKETLEAISTRKNRGRKSQ